MLPCSFQLKWYNTCSTVLGNLSLSVLAQVRKNWEEWLLFQAVQKYQQIAPSVHGRQHDWTNTNLGNCWLAVNKSDRSGKVTGCGLGFAGSWRTAVSSGPWIAALSLRFRFTADVKVNLADAGWFHFLPCRFKPVAFNLGTGLLLPHSYPCIYTKQKCSNMSANLTQTSFACTVNCIYSLMCCYYPWL